MPRTEHSYETGQVAAVNIAGFTNKAPARSRSRSSTSSPSNMGARTIPMSSVILAHSAIGQKVLNINASRSIMLRENLLFEGRFPPEE
jgi:hypothetical protein